MRMGGRISVWYLVTQLECYKYEIEDAEQLKEGVTNE